VIRVFVVYDAEPDADRYERHAELCRKVPGGTFRHGKVFGAPVGDPRFRYYAEWEFADMDAFKAAARSPEFMETGRDGMAMGVPFQVHFADVE
jgi:hypothetical protein